METAACHVHSAPIVTNTKCFNLIKFPKVRVSHLPEFQRSLYSQLSLAACKLVANVNAQIWLIKDWFSYYNSCLIDFD